jgi:hypothetical protein
VREIQGPQGHLTLTHSVLTMFPPEVIDHVLSFLQRDRATLECCAQVHPSLSQLVERHLYAHITIQNFYKGNSDAYYPSDFLKRILDNPNIPKHVRSLRINLFVFRGILSDGYREFEMILPTLTQLQAIFLSSGTGTPVVWSDLRESFRIALTNCLQLPTLTDVKVSNLKSFPLSALDHSSSLKGLLLSGDFASVPSVPSLVYPSLDALILDHCSSMNIVTSFVKSRNLRSLDFMRGSFGFFSRLLEVCANTLTTLKIHVSHECTHITSHSL